MGSYFSEELVGTNNWLFFDNFQRLFDGNNALLCHQSCAVWNPTTSMTTGIDLLFSEELVGANNWLIFVNFQRLFDGDNALLCHQSCAVWNPNKLFPFLLSS